MTPAQTRALAVALDGLRESGFDEATLKRMERSINPQWEEEARQDGERSMRSWWMTALQQEVDPADRQKLTAEQLLEVVGELARPTERRLAAVTLVDRRRRAALRFSPAETATAASTPRLEAAWNCATCGRHACECNRFPGAGAG